MVLCQQPSKGFSRKIRKTDVIERFFFNYLFVCSQLNLNRKKHGSCVLIQNARLALGDEIFQEKYGRYDYILSFYLSSDFVPLF